MFFVLEVNSLFKFKLLSSQIIIDTVLLFLTVTLIFVAPRAAHFSNGTKRDLQVEIVTEFSRPKSSTDKFFNF